MFQVRNGMPIGDHGIAKPDEHADPGRLQPRIVRGNGPSQTLCIQFRLAAQILLQDRQNLLAHPSTVEHCRYGINSFL
jgi:hypothetical protein